MIYDKKMEVIYMANMTEFGRKLLKHILIKQNIFISEYPLDDLANWSGNERQVEYFWVLRNLGLEHGGTILDVGCNNSYFTALLSRQDFIITGIDKDPNSLDTWEFHYIENDVTEFDFKKKKFFDRILLISTLEHIKNDSKAVKNLRETLAENGKFIITVPFARENYNMKWYRVYNQRLLNKLFNIEKQEFFKRCNEKTWYLTTKLEAYYIGNKTGNVITCFVAT